MLAINQSSLSLRSRLYIIVIVATVCTLASLTANFFTIRDYENNIEHIAESELKRLEQIANTFQELSDSHTQLNNLLHSPERANSGQETTSLGENIISRIDLLNSALIQDEKTPALDKQGIPYDSPFDNLAENLKAYRNAAYSSIEKRATDPAQSEKFFLQATENFNRLNSQLSIYISKISRHIHHELEEEIDLINSIYWPVNILLIITAVLVAPLVLKVLRDLSSKFLWIETTLNNLRLGNTDVDIPDKSSDIEMGKIYDSLFQFRRALIELRDSESALFENNRMLIEESNRRQLTEKELRRSLTELSSAMDAAKSSSQSKSLFLANVSHEIRTPLNAILGMAQVLETTELDDEQKDYLDTLYQQGQQLLQMLNNLLDYTQAESGKIKLEFQPFIIASLLEEISSLFKPDKMHKDIKTTINIDPKIQGIMHGDPLRIRQILINLLSNAYKFTEHGEIQVNIKDDPNHNKCSQPVRQQCPNMDSLKCQWQTVFFSVSDTGIGIPKDKQQYIFDNFTQADESYTRKYGGAGMGLAICKQLVELMDGEIGVDSEPGKGSTFWFRICLPDAESADDACQA